MALNVSPDKLREEIEAACDVRDKHIAKVADLVKMFHGGYWRNDRLPPRAVVENHAYEFLSVMVPGVVYDDPRVKIRTANPMQTDALGLTTMGDRALKLQSSLNQWSINDELGGTLVDGLIDFYFAYCVWMVTMADHPGWQGYDAAPQKPHLVLLDPQHFFMDAAARSNDPTKLGGPRLNGHMWKADREDLLSDPMYDKEQVQLLALDSDVEKYDPEKHRGMDPPSRDEIVCWDVWVPERDVRMDHDYQLRMAQMGMEPVDPSEPGYSGTTYTIAACCSNDGIGKRSYYIRPPEPAFAPPWGRYIVSGYMKVPRSPYPLSPIMATAEQAEEVNAHMVAAAEDAASHKTFGVFNNLNAADGQRVKNVRHGHLIGLDEPEGFSTHEIGGVSEAQYKYNQFAQERLRRIAGLSSSSTGEPDADTTATAESIAQQGSQTRVEGIKQAFRRGVVRIFKTAAWYAHHGHGFRMAMGEDAAAIGEPVFYGGISPEEGTYDPEDPGNSFNFFDLSLSLEPYSMGHTDQLMLQSRMEGAWAKLIEAAPLMATTPHIRWGNAIKAFMEVLNIEDADEWIDQEALLEMQVINAEKAMVPPVAPPGMEGMEGEQPAPAAPEEPVAEPTPPASQAMQQQAGQLGAANGVV